MAIPHPANPRCVRFGFPRSLALASVMFGLMAIAAWAQSPTAAKDGSVVLTAEGRVEYQKTKTTVWLPATANQALQLNDQLRTGLRSRATVRLIDQSVLRVDQLTTIQIQPPREPAAKQAVQINSGKTFMLNRERPADVEFRTPQASGAILGTEFALEVRDDGTTILSLIEGQVTMRNEWGEIRLASGEQGVAAAGRPPTKTAMLDAINVIQWCLYYPGVLDPAELNLSAGEAQAITASLTAYRSGDLLQALAAYPEGREPASDDERVYLAGLLLSVGRVPEAERTLQASTSPSPLAAALRVVIAAVKYQPIDAAAEPSTASGLLSLSYHQQSRSDLEAALRSARASVGKSPAFGFGWARVAELEFSFGRTRDAREALDKALQFAPRNAQAIALKGFLFAAENRIAAAMESFEQAIAIDSALGNAWLGRGLCRIRQGDAKAGRQDLQAAAVLEPQRSLFRSYLGKAYSHERDNARAAKELGQARRLDPNDPTPWLYSALVDQQQNQVNQAVQDLSRSQELNDNRSVFRSRQLLDQDRAVRSANLASVYRDAGMFDVSVREASRAVNADPANASAHLFLANSYDTLRDPKRINLRYETAWLSELLVANLLAPVGAGNLSQNVSQQEYSRLFEGDRVGVLNYTEYTSNGDWLEQGSVYGNYGNLGFAIDAEYRSENGYRPNNDREQLEFWAKIKYQLTPQDGLFFLAQYLDAVQGDLAQYYDQASANVDFRLAEKQQPNLYAGYNHEWSPGVNTLFLVGRLADDLEFTDPTGRLIYPRYDRNAGIYTSVGTPPMSFAYARELEAYSGELLQTWQKGSIRVVLGGRVQGGEVAVESSVLRPLAQNPIIAIQDVESDLLRLSAYAYAYWDVTRWLQLTLGGTYDYLDYPLNMDSPPVNPATRSSDLFSPKVGLQIEPWKRGLFRAMWSRSLGGVYFDNSVRLEPVQVAGFVQTFRSAIPESVTGIVPGSEFETWGVGFDQELRSRTYLTVAFQALSSDSDYYVGAVTNSQFIPAPDSPANVRRTLVYDEQTLAAAVNQLLSDNWSVGVRYRLTQAELAARLPDITPTASGIQNFNTDQESLLHQVNLDASFQHPCGFFAQAGAVWSHQSSDGYSPALADEDFWQFNVWAGYRFLQRRLEARVGLLNLTDQDYQLNPLTLYNELPRERTFVASLKFSF